jgi:alkylation response protein AidB-like acyl-CoA dehydrogenase
MIAVNGMSEPDSGSDAFAMKTTAEPEGDGFRLNGTKVFSSNGPVADLAVVFALTDREKGYYGGVTAFLVEKGMKGFEQSQKFEKMGLRTSPLGELVFQDVHLPPDAVLGGVGGGSTLFTDAMDWERIFLFAAQLGTTERLVDKAIAYARVRKQFGQLIGKFQAVSNRIVDMKVRLESARLLVYRAVSLMEAGKPVSMEAAMAKLAVSESLLQTALDTVQVHGGYGFMTEYEVERALRDAVGSTIYSGTSEMQRNIIARWLGL